MSAAGSSQVASSNTLSSSLAVLTILSVHFSTMLLTIAFIMIFKPFSMRVKKHCLENRVSSTLNAAMTLLCEMIRESDFVIEKNILISYFCIVFKKKKRKIDIFSSNLSFI